MITKKAEEIEKCYQSKISLMCSILKVKRTNLMWLQHKKVQNI